MRVSVWCAVNNCHTSVLKQPDAAVIRGRLTTRRCPAADSEVAAGVSAGGDPMARPARSAGGRLFSGSAHQSPRRRDSVSRASTGI